MLGSTRSVVQCRVFIFVKVYLCVVQGARIPW